MDENGDAEGNYTLIARKTYNGDEEFGLFPVGIFALKRSDSRLPVSPIPQYNYKKLKNRPPKLKKKNIRLIKHNSALLSKQSPSSPYISLSHRRRSY
mgnify:CR=1 FL=1